MYVVESRPFTFDHLVHVGVVAPHVGVVAPHVGVVAPHVGVVAPHVGVVAWWLKIYPSARRLSVGLSYFFKPLILNKMPEHACYRSITSSIIFL